MEYRQLPHGTENEKFGVLGLGFGGIGTTPVEEIEAIVRKAIDHGINFFDMCTAGATYAPVGRAIAGRREHCIANMFYFTIAKAWSIRAVIYLLIMTLGNSIGGILFCRLSKKK